MRTLSNLGMGFCRRCQPLRAAPPAPLLSWGGRTRMQTAGAASAGCWGCSCAVRRPGQTQSLRRGQWGRTLRADNVADAWSSTVSGPRPWQPMRALFGCPCRALLPFSAEAGLHMPPWSWVH